MEVEIISRDSVKPSFPTSNHPKTYKISLLDQVSFHFYISFLYFFPANDKNTVSHTLKLLKQSLSHTLNLYYPLAGTSIDNLTIDCNDNGVSYLEARVSCCLTDYLKNPDISCLLEFVQTKKMHVVAIGDQLVSIQVSVFSCGGISIGIAFSHRIFDTQSSISFMKTWADFAKESSVIFIPVYDGSSSFPQNDRDEVDEIEYKNWSIDETPVVRRFVFDGSAISKLKSEAMSYGVINPTRVEMAFSILIKCIRSKLKIISATQKKKPIYITLSVNIRRKAKPHFSEASVGNFLWQVGMLSEETEEPWGFVDTMRKSMSEIKNGDRLNRLKEGYQGLKIINDNIKNINESCSLAKSEGGAEAIWINSWCNLGIYDIDFGWGKPLWAPVVECAKKIPSYFIQLMDTRNGDGIESWVVLDANIMPMLVIDQHLLSFASLDPSPLDIV